MRTPGIPTSPTAARPVAALLALCLSSALAAGWTAAPALQTARQEVAAAWLDGAVYVLGGFGADRSTLASVERWRPGDDAWVVVAPLIEAVNHPAAAVVGGRLVVVGGYRGPGLANATDAVQVYDPETDRWTLAAPLPSPRGGLAAVALDGRVVAIGGARDGVTVADVAAYDPEADAWVAWAPLGQPRNHLGAAVLDGRLHVLGGRSEHHGFTLASHEVYDVVADAWRPAADLPTGRSGHAVAVLDGCLYAFGGEGNRAAGDGMFDEAERYVASTDAWEALPPMPVPRHGMGAVAVGDVIVVAGGGTVAGFGAAAHVDLVAPPVCP
jgi:N-acetylneuraminic acid mutarotase